MYSNYYWFFKPYKFETICRCIVLSGLKVFSAKSNDVTLASYSLRCFKLRKTFGLVISSVSRNTFVLLFKFKYMRICYVIKNFLLFCFVSLLCNNVDIISAILHVCVLLSPILLLLFQCTIPILCRKGTNLSLFRAFSVWFFWHALFR